MKTKTVRYKPITVAVWQALRQIAEDHDRRVMRERHTAMRAAQTNTVMKNARP